MTRQFTFQVTNLTMPSASIFPAKQLRSQDTQRKLINAVHHCLQTKFFEHISIKELCEQANVSVGTFYRRFKNKDALLPLLYQDFGQQLVLWIDGLEQHPYPSLTQAVTGITQKTHAFIVTNRSLFRTIHLNSRLHWELVTNDVLVDRHDIYSRITDILLTFSDNIGAANKKAAANMVVYTMIACLLDKVLYPEIPPAIACELDSDGFCAELPNMLIPYLISQPHNTL